MCTQRAWCGVGIFIEIFSTCRNKPGLGKRVAPPIAVGGGFEEGAGGVREPPEPEDRCVEH